ncbi:MAG: AMP-binding protein [bacterium]
MNIINPVDWLKHQVKTNGYKTFIFTEDKKITYLEFFGHVYSFSKDLQYLNELPVKNIGLLYNNGLEFLYYIFSLWNLGLTPVLFNSKLTDNEIIELYDYSDCIDFFSDRSFDFSFTNKILDLNNINFEGYKQIPNTACIIFTSGTTSKAKGVVLPFESIINSALDFNKTFNCSSDEIFMVSLPFYHIGGLMIVIRALISGSTVFIPKSLKPADFIDGIILSSPAYISVIPKQLNDILERNVVNKNLKALIVGGSATDTTLIQKALEYNLPVYKVYGSSETSSMVTICTPDEVKLFPSSSGKAIGPNKVYSINDKGEINPPDISGEIVVESSTLFYEYYKKPYETNNKLINIRYYTGDIGYINENGFLFIQNRREDLIISGGENISPYEIEQTLKQMPHVKDVCLVGVKDNQWGEVPAAFIIADSIITIPDIIDFLSPKLAPFKIPKHFIFVNQFPLNDMGKINKNALRNLIS